jgi:hypothetical protein
MSKNCASLLWMGRWEGGDLSTQKLSTASATETWHMTGCMQKGLWMHVLCFHLSPAGIRII